MFLPNPAERMTLENIKASEFFNGTLPEREKIKKELMRRVIFNQQHLMQFCLCEILPKLH